MDELAKLEGQVDQSQLNEEEQINAGVAPDMVRLSIGIEDVNDIIWDIDQALNKSQI